MNTTKKYSAEPFFRYNLKSGKFYFILYLVIMIFGALIPVMLILGGMPIQPTKDEMMRIADDSMSVPVTGAFLSVVMALFAGLVSVNHVYSRQKTGTIHSFPMKRETLFVCDTAAHAIYFTVSLVLTEMISYAVFLIKLKEYFSVYSSRYLMCMAASIIVFLFVYSVTLLAGGMTGTPFMRFVMTCVIFFLPIALYALVLVHACTGCPALDVSQYITDKAAKIICPPFRVIQNFKIMAQYGKGFLKFVCMIPEIAVIYAGAIILFRHRRSEDSGTSIIWKPVLEVTKYAGIITAGLTGGLIFSEFFSSSNEVISLVIGGIAFALIAYLIINSVLYRSFSAMFTEVRGFLISVVCLVVFFILVPMNVTGIIGKPYSPETTKKIVVSCNYAEEPIVIEDRDQINAIIDMMNDDNLSYPYAEVYCYDQDWYTPVDNETREIMNEYFPTYLKDENDNSAYPIPSEPGTYEMMRIRLGVTQYPKFGIKYAANYYVNVNSDLWKMMLRTDEVEDYFTCKPNEFNAQDFTGDCEITLFDIGISYYNKFENQLDNFAEIEEMLKLCSYDYKNSENSVMVGNIYIGYRKGSLYHYKAFPIYSDNVELYNCTVRLINKEDPGANLSEAVSESEIFDKFIERCMTYAAEKGRDICAVCIDRYKGTAQLINNSKLRELIPLTTCISNVYYSDVNCLKLESGSQYCLLVATEDGTLELTFREGFDEKELK